MSDLSKKEVKQFRERIKEKDTPHNIDIQTKECANNSALLAVRKSYPLKAKIHLTNERIREWYEHHEGMVYVAFSGGKDSTVLLHLVRQLYPEVPAVFCDTGLEFPENRKFVKSIENVVWLRPKMTFKAALDKYGFPIVSKEVSQKVNDLQTSNSDKLKNIRLHGNEKGHGKLSNKWQFLADAPFKVSAKCCDIYKKNPSKAYEKETGRAKFVGTMTEESSLRMQSYLKTGCNAYDNNSPRSAPISFWTEEDIWEYIKLYDIPYSEVYDMGYERSGCTFCTLGLQHDIKQEGDINRFQKLAITHPKLHSYAINDLGYREKLAYIGITDLDAPEGMTLDDVKAMSYNVKLKQIPIKVESYEQSELDVSI